MRKKYIFGKKLYISILTTIVVFLTTVATTFAWVGVFTNSTFDKFNIEIRASDLEEYGVEISLSGESGTFGETVDSTQLKKVILNNWGYYANDLQENEINEIFNSLNMHQCTNLPVIESNKIIRLGEFKTMEGFLTSNYFKFDIYISPTRYYNEGTPTGYVLDTYLQDYLVSGTVRTAVFHEDFVYPSNFENPLTGLPVGIRPVIKNEIISQCSVNSKSACRVAFEKYEVVDKFQPAMYEGKEPLSTIIYTGDSYNYPTYNTQTSIYEFGGILPDEYNLATGYFNQYEYRLSRNGIKHLSLPSDIYSARGVESATKDVILTSSTNHIIDSSNPNEAIGMGKMIKMTISFWFEGWDADCFNVLNSSPVSLQIVFGTKNEGIF